MVDNASILVTHRGTPATANRVPDFPWVRFHSGMVTYEEALIQGHYLVVNWSAMGRPGERERTHARRIYPRPQAAAKQLGSLGRSLRGGRLRAIDTGMAG